MLKRVRRYFWVIPTGLFLIFIGGFAWLATPVGASMPQAIEAMKSNHWVQVTQDNHLVFSPVGESPTVGFIIYPGAKVPPEAYAPIANAIASEGYLVVIVPMPLNFAIFNITAADSVMAEFATIETWAIGGHSLGGAMSAWYVYDNPDKVDGLVLWASYPDSSKSLADFDLKVVSVYGELDGLATPEKVMESEEYLPSSTTFVEIKGGNHANFGWYGDQPGDKLATISRESQTEQMIEATVALLSQLQD